MSRLRRVLLSCQVEQAPGCVGIFGGDDKVDASDAVEAYRVYRRECFVGQGAGNPFVGQHSFGYVCFPVGGVCRYRYAGVVGLFHDGWITWMRQCLFSLILCLCGRALSGSVGRWPDVWGSRLRNCGSLKSLHARTCRCSCGAAPQARRRWCAGRRYARICCHSNSGCVRFFFNSAFFLLIHGVRQRSCYA